MKIHLYTMSKNETEMLGFFFRHFDPWVDRYVIFDDKSTDNTLDLLAAHPRVEVRPLPYSSPDSFVESAQSLHDNFWKESRGIADWVVVTAIDEHLFLPGRSIQDYLAQCSSEGVTCIPGLGHQMISDEFPDPGEWLCQTRHWGAPYPNMSKLSLFDPNAVKETNYAPGRHSARPEGRIRYPANDELLVLHYKYLGFERTYSRQRYLGAHLGKKDVASNWGFHYLWPMEKHREVWDSYASKAIDILTTSSTEHEKAHADGKWWRPRPSK